jgi:hypothetical protein
VKVTIKEANQELARLGFIPCRVTWADGERVEVATEPKGWRGNSYLVGIAYTCWEGSRVATTRVAAEELLALARDLVSMRDSSEA